jgi:hypothetical protein
MQQICCSYFSTSIASVWTVETRCFLSSSNTGKKSNMFDFLPVLPEFLAILLSAVWTLRSPLLLKNEQQPISALLFVLVLLYYFVILLVCTQCILKSIDL